MRFQFPHHLEKLIRSYAAYTSDPWLPVAEHKKYDYGWIPMLEMVEDLVNLPGL